MDFTCFPKENPITFVGFGEFQKNTNLMFTAKALKF